MPDHLNLSIAVNRILAIRKHTPSLLSSDCKALESGDIVTTDTTVDRVKFGDITAFYALMR